MSSIARIRKASITNQNSGGGSKLAGTFPHVGGNAFTRAAWARRAYVPQDKRGVVFCINQIGGIGKRSSMFGSTADGVKCVKDTSSSGGGAVNSTNTLGSSESTSECSGDLIEGLTCSQVGAEGADENTCNSTYVKISTSGSCNSSDLEDFDLDCAEKYSDEESCTNHSQCTWTSGKSTIENCKWTTACISGGVCTES